ncbi:hypothetical protein HPB49_011253 [Dermacentor silvarum]|uniref:Uncharacterized protein n=1 Tax=Dermacentor silvarum TaxID=543639 RepID=A0ACB8DCL0_DERSI|nr:uncharacterized protein LOC119441064 [Dermacentor silvarum]KAH7965814.1 hypothetical protein HPB49_011253 [Dermacentor silvarum]
MKQTFAAIFLLGLVAFAANAYMLPEEESSLDSVAQEAVCLGEILRDVAQTLDEDEELSAASEEYFFRALWSKAKEAVKNATEKMKESVKGAYKEAKENLQKAAKEAQEKLKEKAAEIMSKLLSKVTSGYALQEADWKSVNFIKLFVDAIKAAAQRFLNIGKALEHLQN